MIIPTDVSDQVVAHGLIAFFGAIVHALDANRQGKTKSFADIVALTVMSSFTGIIFALLAGHFLPNEPYLSLAIAGTGGYLGIEGMSYVVYYLQYKGILPKQK